MAVHKPVGYTDVDSYLSAYYRNLTLEGRSPEQLKVSEMRRERLLRGVHVVQSGPTWEGESNA